MKTYTLEELQEEYNNLKVKWGFLDTKDFLDILKFREEQEK